jgi:hypothetical protein
MASGWASLHVDWMGHSRGSTDCVTWVLKCWVSLGTGSGVPTEASNKPTGGLHPVYMLKVPRQVTWLPHSPASQLLITFDTSKPPHPRHLWSHVVQRPAAAEGHLLIVLDGQAKVSLARGG